MENQREARTLMPKLAARPAIPANAVTTAEMAAMLGCSATTLYRNYRKGLYRKGIHYGHVSPHSTKPRIRWNAAAVLKLHGITVDSRPA